MAYSRAKTTVSGRHSRPPGAEEVRRACLAVLTMLIAQYALGIFLNLFVTVPGSDQHASMLGEIMSGPFALTVHALLGLSLIGTAIVLLARVVKVEDPVLITLATAALGAIGGAFAAGEIFVKNGQSSASFMMALLAGGAMLCYVGMLARISAPQRRRAHAREAQPAGHARGGSGLLADPDPAPDPAPGPDRGWSEPGWSEQGWREDTWVEPAWSETPPPLPVRHKQDIHSERTVVGVTWEAPWSRGPGDWRLTVTRTAAAAR
jgi:hypothetical protein